MRPRLANGRPKDEWAGQRGLRLTSWGIAGCMRREDRRGEGVRGNGWGNVNRRGRTENGEAGVGESERERGVEQTAARVNALTSRRAIRPKRGRGTRVGWGVGEGRVLEGGWGLRRERIRYESGLGRRGGGGQGGLTRIRVGQGRRTGLDLSTARDHRRPANAQQNGSGAQHHAAKKGSGTATPRISSRTHTRDNLGLPKATRSFCFPHARMLGAETKSFRSYGKRKTNITNKPRAWNLSSPDRPVPARSSPESVDEASTDDEDDKWDPALRPPPASCAQPLALIKAKRRPLAHPSKSPNRRRRLDPDKENEDSAGSTVEAPRRPLLKPRNRLVVQSPASVASKRSARGRGSGKSSLASDVESSLDEVRRPSPLKPKAVGKRPVPVASFSSCHRLDEVTTDGKMPPPPTRPPRRTRASHVAPIIVVDPNPSGEKSEDASSPLLVSKPLPSGDPSPSRPSQHRTLSPKLFDLFSPSPSRLLHSTSRRSSKIPRHPSLQALAEPGARLARRASPRSLRPSGKMGRNS